MIECVFSISLIITSMKNNIFCHSILRDIQRKNRTIFFFYISQFEQQPRVSGWSLKPLTLLIPPTLLENLKDDAIA